MLCSNCKNLYNDCELLYTTLKVCPACEVELLQYKEADTFFFISDHFIDFL
jgi:hypothetical protein